MAEHQPHPGPLTPIGDKLRLASKGKTPVTSNEDLVGNMIAAAQRVARITYRINREDGEEDAQHIADLKAVLPEYEADFAQWKTLVLKRMR